MRLALSKQFVILSAIACACGGDATASRRTVVIASPADADVLLPPVSRTLAAKAVTDNLFDKLAASGPSLNTIGDAGFEPRLAQKWEWSADSMRVIFHMNPRAHWHDGSPVRANDVAFAFSVYTDPSTDANGGTDLRETIDSVTTSDSLTCTAWFRSHSPERFFTLVTTLVPLPQRLLAAAPRDSLATAAFARAPVGSGPFRLVKWDARVSIELAAVDDYYGGRPKLDRVIWSITPDMQSATLKLFAGEAQFLEALTPDALANIAKNPGVVAERYGSLDYGFVRFNLRDGAGERAHPLFGSTAMRRALVMALDRHTLVRSVFDSLARDGLGPFVRAQWSSDSTLAQLPFDRAAAARTLDSLGWKAGADGMRSKNGRPLAFSLLVPSSSRVRGKFAVLIQEQLRQAGVKVNIETLDFGAFMERRGKHTFDAILDGSHANASPAGIRETWTTAGIQGGKGPNAGSYSSRAFDAEVDSAVTATSIASAKPHYRAAYQTIIDDAPAIWLFEAIATAGVSKGLQTGPLRADGWWLNLAKWTAGRN